MDTEQFKQKMLAQGVDEETFVEVFGNLIILVQETAYSIAEILEQLARTIEPMFETMKDAFKELVDVVEEVFDETSPDTKGMKLNKRLEYVNTNKFVNQVIKRYCNRDIRLVNMKFTRYRQKH